ncbi:MAG: alpha/beta fold hydrolase [bacterium]
MSKIAGRLRVLAACEALSLLIVGSVRATSQALRPASGEQSSVQGGALRLQINTSKSAKLSAAPVLLVVLHGDAPFNKPDYQNVFAARVAATNDDVVSVALLRPGYTDPKGNKSDGVRGLTTGDNYNATNTDAIAAAIDELKRRWHARKVVVAGHSGGAAITANILGRHPRVIDAALLVSCPCDVDKWRQHMFQLQHAAVFQGKIETLSPIEHIAGISDRANILMMVGDHDEIAPPDISVSYQAAAAKLGKHVRLAQLPGKGHEIFLEDAVFAALAPLLK